MKTNLFKITGTIVLLFGMLTNVMYGQCTIGQPNISVQAAAFSNITIVEGTTTTLTSPVSGSTYQWALDGVNISGATSAILTINTFSTSDVGDYTLTVDGVTLSNAVSLGMLATSITDYDRDRQALVDLYNSTNGGAWLRNTNWLMGPMETWEGVIVENCRVTRLSLSGNNISGVLPDSFRNLTGLKRLSLRNNDISGIADITTMPSLTHVYLSNNNFTDIQFGNNDILQTVHIQSNPLTSGKTIDISAMRGLIDFRASRTNLSGLTVSGRYDSLRYLMISENQLPGTLDISNMPNLSICYAHGNQFTGFRLGSHPELNRLYLYNNPVTPGSTIDISSMRKLLDFRVQGLGLSQLRMSGTYDELLYFIIKDNQIGGTLDISNMPNLAICYAHRNQFTDFRLGSHPALSRFYFYDNPITPGRTMDISSMRKLLDFRVQGLGLSDLVVSGTYDDLLYFIIKDNQIGGTLDVSMMPNLRLCTAYDNQFTDFRLGSHPELSRFYFYNNPITPGRTMDISSMRKLLDFRVQGLGLSQLTMSGSYNELLYFIVKDNALEDTLDLSNMPNIILCNAENNFYDDLLLPATITDPDSGLSHLYVRNNNIPCNVLEPYIISLSAVNFLYNPQRNAVTCISPENTLFMDGRGADNTAIKNPSGANASSFSVATTDVYPDEVNKSGILGLVIYGIPIEDIVSSSIDSNNLENTSKELDAITDIKLFPNPITAGDPIEVVIDVKESQVLRLNLHTIQGKKMKNEIIHAEKGNSRYTVNSDGLAPGIYLLTIEIGTKTINRKIIIR